MAGQGPHAKAAAAAAAKRKSSKSELAALLETADNELSCASVEELSEDLAELVVTNLTTLLDSSATSHLVKQREFFWTYNKEEAWNVKTANLGILQTHASGTCVARFMYNGESTKVTLRNCLHAPNAFVNLLSVGQFVTGSVACTFDNACVTLSKGGKSFGYGPMANKLFALEVEFLKPPIKPSTPTSALTICQPSNAETALFTKVLETLELWHYHMGHPGEPATIALLKLTMGASFPPGKSLTHCELCIFRKQAQLPAPTSTTPHSKELLELIHVDICSPFSVTTPHGKLYFILFLEDASSIVTNQETATLLWLSLDALAVLEHPKASWDVLGCLRMSQDS
jgi:hypothetical protein